MNFLTALVFALLLAGPASADPASAIIALAGGTAAVGTVGAFAIRIGVGLALSAIGTALQRRKADPGPGIRTQVTTQGGTVPQTFILGRYATNGNVVAPHYSHGQSHDWENGFRNTIIDLSDVPLTALNAIWVDDRKLLWPADFTGAAHPDYGSRPDETRFPYESDLFVKFYDGTQTAADPFMVSKYGSRSVRPWSSDMIGRGVAYALITTKFAPEIYQGDPVFRFECNGIRLYDPRKDTSAGGTGTQRWATPSTWQFSENPAVMVYNLLRGIPLEDGSTYGLKVAAANLPTTSWFAAMNTCDDVLDAEVRYRAGYEVRMATAEDGGDAPLDVIDELLKSCDASLVDLGGQWQIRVGAPALPIATITDEDILRNKPQDLDPFRGLAETFNAVRASHPLPASGWQPTEAPPRYDAAGEAEDGQRLVADINLPAVYSTRQAQLLMRAWLLDARRMRRHTITLPPEYGILTPLDTLSWTSDRNGYLAKRFEIAEMSVDPLTLCVTMSIRERDPADYDWQAGFVLPHTAPSGVVVTQEIGALPGFQVAPISLRDAAGVNRRPGLRLSWPTTFTTIDAIAWQIRLAADATSVVRGTTADVSTGEIKVSEGLLPNTAYEVRARGIRQTTDWTVWNSVTTPDTKIKNTDLEGGIRGVLSGEGLTTTETVTSLPTTGNFVGRRVYLTTNGKTYTWNGVAWVTGVAAVDISGTLTTANFAQDLRPVEIGTALPTTGNFEGRQFYLTTDGKRYTYTSGAWKNTIDAADLTGLLDITRFANSIRPPERLGSLPTTGNFDGRLVYLTTNSKLYRYTAAGQWDAGTNAIDIVGQLVAGQIAANAIGAVHIAAEAITATKLAITDAGNLNTDSDLIDPASWTGTGVTYVAAVSAEWGSANYLRLTGAGGTAIIANGPKFQVNPAGEEIYYAVKIQNVGGVGTGNIQIQVSASADFSNPLGLDGTPHATATRTEVSGTITIPPGYAYGRLRVRKDSNGATESRFGGIVARRKNAGRLLVDGDIQARHMGVDSVSAGAIAAGAITAREAAVGAFIASRIAVTSWENLFTDGTFQNQDADLLALSGAPGGTRSFSTVAKTGGHSLQITKQSASLSIADELALQFAAPVKAGSMYYWETEALVAGTGSATSGFFLQLRWFDSAGGLVSSVNVINNSSLSTNFQYFSGQALAPAGATRCTWKVHNNSDQLSIRIDRVVLREANAGSLVVNGSLKATHLETDAFKNNGLALFGGDIRSTNFAAGSSGWRITNAGNAEFSNLISRSDLKSNSVTEVHQAIGLGPYGTFQSGSPTWVTTLTLPAIPRGSVLKRGTVFEARSFGTTEIVMQFRTAQLGGGYGGWVEIRRWSTNVTGWDVFADSGNLSGYYDAVQYRVGYYTSYADAATVLRNIYITILDVTK